jgi:hypothetical protein
MEIIISSLIFVVVGTFAIGYGFGGSTSSSSSLSSYLTTIATSLLNRFDETLMSSSSPWWNLYTTIVSSYITIRLFNLFINPILELIASKIFKSNNNNKTAAESKSSSLLSSSKRSLSTTSRRVTTKDRSLQSDDDDNEQQQQQPNNELQKQKQKHKQPIDMTGNYQLILNENFEAFLGTQGVPRMFQSIASKSRPIHRIIHIGSNLSIKIEGIVDTYTEYSIDGPSIITKIRGKPFTDSVTYLTLEELGLKPNPEPTTTTTTNIDTVTANNANPSSDNDYASGDSGTLTADDGNDCNDDNDDNDNDKKRDNKRGSTLDKIKKSLSSKKREIKTNISKGGNLRASKVKRLIQNKSTSSSNSIDEEEDNDSDNETYSIVEEIDSNNKKKRSSSSSSSNGPNTGTICGIKNIKRQDDEKYTLTVHRRFRSLHEIEKSKIEVILHVVYDDSKKDDVIAKQLFERI